MRGPSVRLCVGVEFGLLSGAAAARVRHSTVKSGRLRVLGNNNIGIRLLYAGTKAMVTDCAASLGS